MDVVALINKQYGKGSAVKLSDKPQEFEFIPTSSPVLDEALGGGIAKGRVIEVYGKEGSSKTTLALHILSNVEKAWFIDVEHALNPSYAKALGVDIDNLPISQPDTAEQALDICESITRDGGYDLIVIDSVAALVPMAEVEGEMADSEMAMRARLMSKALRKLVPLASKTNTTLLFINQTRDKIGGYGSPEVTPGGRALGYSSSQRIQLRASKRDEKGMKVHAKIVKNKVAIPFKTCEMDLIYGEGYSKELAEIQELIEKGEVKKEGGWYLYKGKKYRLEKLRQLLK